MRFVTPSWNDIVECKPTWETQTASLLIATITLKFAMDAAEIIVSSIIKSIPRLNSHTIKGAVKEMSGKAVDRFNSPTHFKDFCKPGQTDFYTWRDRKAKDISDANYNGTTPRRAKLLLKHTHALDAYLAESEENRHLFEDYARKRTAENLVMFLQHGVAGCFGLVGLSFAQDADTRPLFFKLLRWGLLCEAGWELSDFIWRIIPDIIRGELDQNGKLSICHHCCLYAVLPVNLYLVGGPLSEDIAWTLFLLAGCTLLMLPLALCQPIWDTLNNEESNRVARGFMFIVMAVVMTGIMICRYPLNWMNAYNLVTKSAAMDITTSYMILALEIFFQSFNMMVFVMAIRAGLTAKKNSPDESSVRLFETTLRALLNPRAFALVRQNQAKARWTKLKAAVKLGILRSDPGRVRLNEAKQRKQQTREANKKTN